MLGLKNIEKGNTPYLYLSRDELQP